MASELEKLLAAGSMTAAGGYAQAALGGAQALYGLTQLPRARAEFERARAAAPSLETPSQFYENYKNAYDSTLARMQSDAIQANLATSVQALQGAGGRALVGGLTQATSQAQQAQTQMLAQERQMRLAAGQQLAGAEERAIGRKEARSQQEIAYANQAYQAALGNIGAGLASAGEGAMYGMSAVKQQKQPQQTQVSPKQLELQQKDLEKRQDFVAETRQMVQEQDTPDFLKAPQFETRSLTETFLPAAFRNEQAMKQLGALASNYNQFFGVAPEQQTEAVAPGNLYQNLMNVYKNPYKLKNGGMMTKGAFNHNTNPIDLVQNGQKVGEATGGEYILNPSQAAAVAKQSSYARKLFKRFEKNAKKNK